jgi:C1A family cysteine protease
MASSMVQGKRLPQCYFFYFALCYWNTGRSITYPDRFGLKGVWFAILISAAVHFQTFLSTLRSLGGKSGIIIKIFIAILYVNSYDVVSLSFMEVSFMMHKYSYKRDMPDTRDFKFSKSATPHPDIILPGSVDLRPKCPPVYDQGDLGSCTANAGCTCRAMLLQDEQINLSRMYLYYMERVIEGNVCKDDGASLRDTCKSIYKAGICEETYMPYIPAKYSAQPSRPAIYNASQYTIAAYKSLSSLDAIIQNIAFRQQPVLLGMDVYESFESDLVSETGIMPMPRETEKKLGSHAVLVVGYRSMVKYRGRSGQYRIRPGYLIVRNSWGDQWGDKGYFYMPYDYVVPMYTYDYWIME